MNDLLDQLLKISIKSALEAGEKVMEIYESSDFEIEIKQDLSPITKADKISNEIMKIKGLKCKVFPIETSEYPTKAKRPHFSLLNKKKIKMISN